MFELETPASHPKYQKIQILT